MKKLLLGLATMALSATSLSAAPDCLYVRGTMNDWGAEPSWAIYPSSTDANVYTGSFQLGKPTGNPAIWQFKIADDSWSTYNYGSDDPVSVYSDKNYQGTLVDNGGNITITNWEGGTFDVSFNLSNRQLTVAGPQQPAYNPNTDPGTQNGIYLVGQPNGWSIAYSAFFLPEIESGIYENTLDIAAGEFMFRFYSELGNWDANSIGSQQNDKEINIILTDGVYTGNLVKGGKGSWSVSDWAGGEVKMTVDLNNNKVTFAEVVEPGVPTEMYLMWGQSTVVDPTPKSDDPVLTMTEDGVYVGVISFPKTSTNFGFYYGTPGEAAGIYRATDGYNPIALRTTGTWTSSGNAAPKLDGTGKWYVSNFPTDVTGSQIPCEVTLNLNDMTLTVKVSAEQAGGAPNAMYIWGTTGGFTSAARYTVMGTMKPSASDPKLFEVTMDVPKCGPFEADGEYKKGNENDPDDGFYFFLSDNNASMSSGSVFLGTQDNHVIDLSNSPYSATLVKRGAGSEANLICVSPGEVKFTFNWENQEFTATMIEPLPSVPEVMYLMWGTGSTANPAPAEGDQILSLTEDGVYVGEVDLLRTKSFGFYFGTPGEATTKYQAYSFGAISFSQSNTWVSTSGGAGAQVTENGTGKWYISAYPTGIPTTAELPATVTLDLNNLSLTIEVHPEQYVEPVPTAMYIWGTTGGFTDSARYTVMGTMTPSSTNPNLFEVTMDVPKCGPFVADGEFGKGNENDPDDGFYFFLSNNNTSMSSGTRFLGTVDNHVIDLSNSAYNATLVKIDASGAANLICVSPGKVKFTFNWDNQEFTADMIQPNYYANLNFQGVEDAYQYITGKVELTMEDEEYEYIPIPSPLNPTSDTFDFQITKPYTRIELKIASDFEELYEITSIEPANPESEGQLFIENVGTYWQMAVSYDAVNNGQTFNVTVARKPVPMSLTFGGVENAYEYVTGYVMVMKDGMEQQLPIAPEGDTYDFEVTYPSAQIAILIADDYAEEYVISNVVCSTEVPDAEFMIENLETYWQIAMPYNLDYSGLNFEVTLAHKPIPMTLTFGGVENAYEYVTGYVMVMKDDMVQNLPIKAESDTYEFEVTYPSAQIALQIASDYTDEYVISNVVCLNDIEAPEFMIENLGTYWQIAMPYNLDYRHLVFYATVADKYRNATFNFESEEIDNDVYSYVTITPEALSGEFKNEFDVDSDEYEFSYVPAVTFNIEPKEGYMVTEISVMSGSYYLQEGMEDEFYTVAYPETASGAWDLTLLGNMPSDASIYVGVEPIPVLDPGNEVLLTFNVQANDVENPAQYVTVVYTNLTTEMSEYFNLQASNQYTVRTIATLTIDALDNYSIDKVEVATSNENVNVMGKEGSQWDVTIMHGAPEALTVTITVKSLNGGGNGGGDNGDDNGGDDNGGGDNGGEDGPTDGIAGINAENGIVVYNLQGVKVVESRNLDDLRNLEPGLYIINGQKVLLRK